MTGSSPRPRGGRAITVTSLSSHYIHNPSRSGLIFGYAALPEMAMKAELSRMRETFHSIVRASRGQPQAQPAQVHIG